MVWWLAAMPYVLKCTLLSVLIQSLIIMVASTKSECNRTRFGEACQDIRIRERLKYLSNQSVTKRTSIDCASRRWFHSPDDRPSYTLLNSSSSKYLIQNDNLSLNFSSVSASDEGIYGCIDSGHNRINHICVEVYGKAVFASCPHELKCTKNESLTLPANGGSVRFNATVTYIPGGSCGYLQNLTLIKLKKINKTTGKKIKLMCTYRFNEGSCRPNEENSVTLSRGSSGFEFVLTLFNVSADSIGTYEVIVETEHPGAGDKIYLTKRYHVVESTISTPTTPTPSPSPPPTSETITIMMTPTSMSPTVTNISGSGHPTVVPVTTLGLIGGFIGAFIVIVIIAIIAVAVRKSVASHPRNKDVSRSSEEECQEVNSSTPICHHNGQNQATRYDVMTISFHGQEDDFDTEAPAPDPETSRDITLPPTNDTLSIIDDMELFDGQMNSNDVAVTVTL